MAKDETGGVDRRAALGLMAGPVAAAAAGGLARPAAAAPPIPLSQSAGERIFTEEVYDITVEHRLTCLDWFSTWPAKMRGFTHGQVRNFGVWGTLGMTHSWAEGVVMWDWGPKTDMAGLMQLQASSAAGAADSRHRRFWEGAPADVAVTQAVGRTLASTAYSPTLEALIAAGVGPAAYLHWTVATPPGGIHRFLQDLQADWLPVAGRMGLQFLGAWRILFGDDDQGVVLWGFPTWRAWANWEDERRTDPAALKWRAKVSAQGVTWTGRGLIGARADPLRSGVVV